MNRLSRLLRHWRSGAASGKRSFPPATLKAIEAAIRDGEMRHRAEVRMIIEPALPLSAAWSGVSARERARELFAHYGVWDTEENCGVLVYVNLADRKVEIVVDRGVGKVVSAGQWQAICRTMTRGFAEGRYHESVLAALVELNALLQAHYPDDADDADDGSARNQLPDKPLVL